MPGNERRRLIDPRDTVHRAASRVRGFEDQSDSRETKRSLQRMEIPPPRILDRIESIETRKIGTVGLPPTIANGAAIGTGGPVSTPTIAGNDWSGDITFATRTTPGAANQQAVIITFSTPLPDTLYDIGLEARNVHAGYNTVGRFAERISASQWAIRFANAPPASTEYWYFYEIRPRRELSE